MQWLEQIPIECLVVRSHNLWANQWFLLTAGDFKTGKYNTMTVAWGGFGTMWNKPFAHVVVRPTRYTHEFMEKYDSFTLCAFPEEYRSSVQLCGTRSGRKCDKIKEACLTPFASTKVAAPCFREAELVVECRKMYRGKVDPAGFLDNSIINNYPEKDYHTIYYGEIVAVSGIEQYNAD
jgi:flavin reductase (DIM6/NTAB) family NADH-FMN oxidoreductase RutF